MSFKTRLRAALVIWGSLAMGCATAKQRIVVTSCVNDPLTKSCHYVDSWGADQDVPWEKMVNWVCRPSAEDNLLMNAAHAQ